MELNASLGSGFKASGCRCCGNVFTSGSGFDMHWQGWRKRAGKCRPPAECGLTQNEKGRWHAPSEDRSLRDMGEILDARDVP
jgi:hypothetical protein